MRFHKIYTGVVVRCIVAVLAGWGGPAMAAQGSAAEVKAGVAFAKKTFERVGQDPLAAVCFGSNIEQGGDALTYLASCMSDAESKVRYCSGRPETNYTVSVGFDNSAQYFVVEGYTDNLEKPAWSEKVPYQGVVARRATGGAERAVQDPAPSTDSFFDVCRAGDVDAVKKMLARGVDVNARSLEGSTALMYASAGGNPEVVKLLLAAHADPKVHANDANGWPALMFAANKGSVEIVGLLLAQGAPVNDTDKYKDTPLMIASLRGHAAVVESLIQAGAALNAQETRNNNFSLLHAANAGQDEVARALVKAGANVNLCDKSGTSALMCCAEKGRTTIAGMLLEARANTEAQLTGGVGVGATALMLATAKGQEAMVRVLLAGGANPLAADKGGNTALRYALHNHRDAIAELLRQAESGPRPKPAAAVAVAAPAGDLKSLVGKDQQAADALLGRPSAKMVRGDTTILMYKGGEVTLKQGVVTAVRF